ncbi:UNVERIFIED_CONTAM: hypothetical protein PYX00_011849 [Menopon gallinae]|uniref:Dynein axonemal assembly factor 1 homolog n=1 Tax=Menopon gallinae TaxID=328185 RepID=A0AAW2H9B8_9NEOP
MSSEEVYVVHEKLEAIPEVHEPCRKATFRRNKIAHMELTPCRTLEELDLYDNVIKKIEGLERVPSLRILDLSFNLIQRNTVPLLPHLAELYLIGNDIHKIERMYLPSLEKLDMAENGLKRIENLEGLQRLRELYLGCNKIEKIENIKHLAYLEVLDLQNNCLLEVDCADIPVSVKTLLLSGNVDLVQIKNIGMLSKLDFVAINKTKLSSQNITEACKAEIWS